MHGLVSVGWAEQLYTPHDPYEHDPEPLMFRLTPDNDRSLAYFLVYYYLLNRGACTPAGEAPVRNDPPTEAKTAFDRWSKPVIDANFILLVLVVFGLLLLRDAIFG